MSLIRLVCVLLVTGSLRALSVVAAEHDREEQQLSDKIVALSDKLINNLFHNQLEESVNMFHPDASLSFEGYPPITGKEAIRKLGESLSRKLSRVDRDYLETAPLEEGAPYVYVLYTQRLYDHEDKLVDDNKALIIWKNTDDGYMVYRLMCNSNN